MQIFAQDAAPTLPSDPTLFMLRAAQANILSQTGDQAWHLKVAFRIFDEQGNAKDQGTYDEFYVNPSKFKRSYSATGFSQTDYGTDKGTMRSGSPNWPDNSLFGYIRQAFVYPSTGMVQITRLDLSPELREVNGAKYLCIPMKTKPPSPDVSARLVATYCFESGPDSLRIAYWTSREGPITLIRSHPVSFEGRSLPGDLELDIAGRLALSAHIETLAPVTAADDAVFTPSPDATPLRIQMIRMKEPGPAPNTVQILANGKVEIPAKSALDLLLTKTQPEYPPIARAARVQGIVVLRATISKTGSIENLSVISGPAMLQQAALDAVKQWTYKPYPLNGEPAEVMTTINVMFSLGNPPPPNAQP
jgi:TonB family protein